MKNLLKFEEIRKNNELFSNSLTYKIVGEKNFKKLLNTGNYDKHYINQYTSVIRKYCKDFGLQLKLKLQDSEK